MTEAEKIFTRDAVQALDDDVSKNDWHVLVDYNSDCELYRNGECIASGFHSDGDSWHEFERDNLTFDLNVWEDDDGWQAAIYPVYSNETGNHTDTEQWVRIHAHLKK
jgi:hypothetical protein